MGKIKQGILGAVSGKVGGVIGSSWKGIAYLKVMPASVANPNTAGQQTQRSAFSGIVAIASDLLSATVKPLWDRFAQFQSGYNAFVSANIATFVGSVFTYPENFIISRGKLVGFDNPSLAAPVGNTGVTVSWDDNTGEGDALATDEAYLVFYNEDTGEWGQSTSHKTRDFLSQNVPSVDGFSAGDTVHVWFGFRRADGTSVSDSQYLTDVVPA